MESTTSGYRPGVCNIGSHERRRRYRLGIGAVLVGIVYLALVVVTGLPAVFALGGFVPLSLGCEWCLQGRQSFCATLGFAGRYEFAGEAGAVPDSEARRADRRYAFRLTVLGLLGGGVLAVVAYVTLLLF